MSINGYATNLKKTSIQLMWLDQFEFAGFYIAKEKGFYEKAGLDVEIKKYRTDLDLTQTILDGKSDFGLNSSSIKSLNLILQLSTNQMGQVLVFI